ncbi:hypothetical protein, partial [Klebsiella pneumoniae]|uniref:hypothetical protein n=1 Tax=Klebsiella pneumoniae TaxID=573 RepID=UPI0039C2B883
LHGDVLMWLMKTLLTSRCINQRGAGHEYLLIFSPVDVLIICESILSKRKTSRYTLITSGWAVMVSRYLRQAEYV